MSTIRNIQQDFGSAVKTQRLQLCLTQEELAERSGLHRTYITDIERGVRNVSLRSVERLARALETTLAELLYNADRKQNISSGRVFPGMSLVDILLVEDNPRDEEWTIHALRRARLANIIHVARDGAEALDFLFRTGRHSGRKGDPRPSLVLLDLRLPKIDGLEVLRRVKADKRTRDLPVVVLTVSESGEDAARARRLGAAGYIVKPVDFQGLSRVTPELNLSWVLQRSFVPANP